LSEDDTHPYLTGPWAPVAEETQAFDLPVRGSLPVGLDGLYARTGPNPLPDRDPARYHWLTGDGMVHGIRLAGGRAEWYRNRWVTSSDVSAHQGRPAPELPDTLVPEGTGNTSLLAHGGRLYAFSEMGAPYALSGSLDTLAAADFGGPLPAGAGAHARRDARSGELHVLAGHPEPPFLRHHVIDARGRLCSTRVLPVERPTLVHDFALTETHLVLFDLPVLFDEEAMMDGEPLPWRWQAGAPAFVGLVARCGEPEARWFEIDPCWVPHVAAVRDEGGRTTVDAIRRPSLFAEDLRGDDDGAPVLMRCVLEGARGSAVTSILDPTPQDFPVVDPRRAPGAARIVHSLGIVERDGRRLPAGDRVIRHDTVSGERRAHRLPRGWLASELTFVPAHPRAAEDDGWLTGFLHDERRERARFVVLDARDPGAGPLAEIDLPGRIPLGLHGCWAGD
jgi:carotenoid cleavage dioxygenase